MRLRHQWNYTLVENSHYTFSSGPNVYWLWIRGSLDLHLYARVETAEKAYHDIPQPPQSWPYLVVSATKGKLVGIRSSDEHYNPIIEATSEHGIVLIRPHGLEGVRMRERDVRTFAPYEAIFDFRYTK